MDEDRTNRTEINSQPGLFDRQHGVMTAPSSTRGAQNIGLDASEMPPADGAYEVVLKDLQSKLRTNPPGEMRATVEQALAALDAVTKLHASVSAMGSPDAAAAKPPKPWSSADIEDEVAREQLDP